MEDLKEDIKFIVDETLDFGGLSPSDSHEEEDITVLVSPEKPLRRGLSHRSNPNAVAPALQGVRFSLGPLSPEKLEEILDEANRLAAQLEECALKDSENAAAGPGRPSPRGKPSPRRETFVLKDSPVRDLLPTVSSWSAPPPSNLTGLRSSDKKGSARAGRVTAGKKPSSIKKESPTCNLFSASKNPGRSPLAQPTLPPRRKTGSGARTVASPPIPVRPAPQSSASNSQCSSWLQGAAAKSSSRLPFPSAIPKPAIRMPLTGRSIPAGKGALAPDPLPTQKGHPSTVGHRAPVSQRTNLPTIGAARGRTSSAARGRVQPLRKAAVPGPTR
ncbi:rCG28569, isoform CRA_a [Rattus norvegicus]|uniref:Proline/serine-rich coiled-coil protein 1 n=3 Tax=Rattus norvegicus TaxID=10116 RepID=PSRC1_RAT|nr:proline/serine-rich coiled-coil protein 1 [Rattus norvegicus]XP_006233238.1 proline/serine-rich coiled-coil protein 1 isoform X3 [Rattus norvegicus]XP_006233241.1 proline/serine-rich coiled-coil protein 1 isoform X3 [Rattus norvegicus]Q3KR66.1 RecName: Full=Proline/serine-rich coiled-coil protein 1 [Rattus norvegicus]AAI05875.1 Proline/serine-rich coiled-coil 1 [Rattus norvegicus]EDL81935.1 rCG28569, isoform CRA_a [Rattus norvegicus]EDL81936.1 rCG28569, isoform CRA_a [Rattus norvegicus]|eukprot:NP_001037767.1 proline/serine-rich coiled-coil protein 1 [Rattus norvegicus]